jgi:hypothetical protein
MMKTNSNVCKIKLERWCSFNSRVMQSLPIRGSVGSPFLIETWVWNGDPTLPRIGTDCMFRELKTATDSCTRLVLLSANTKCYKP